MYYFPGWIVKIPTTTTGDPRHSTRSHSVIYVHSTVKDHPRQPYRVCSCCYLSRTNSRPDYNFRISCCYSRAKSIRVWFLVVLLHCWHFSPSVLSGTVRIRRRGPLLRHIFFPVWRVSQKINKTANRTRSTRYLPQTHNSRCIVW